MGYYILGLRTEIVDFLLISSVTATLDELIPFRLNDELYQIAWETSHLHEALQGAKKFVQSGIYEHKWHAFDHNPATNLDQLQEKRVLEQKSAVKYEFKRNATVLQNNGIMEARKLMLMSSFISYRCLG